MTYNQLLLHDESFRYQLLDRMKQDCIYYLDTKHETFWAKSKREQIEYMFFLHQHFKIEPEWLSLDDINQYAKDMNVDTFTRCEFIYRHKNRGVIFVIYRKWGDEKHDRLECFTYPDEQEKLECHFVSTKRYINPMDFLLYCQANYQY